MRNACVVTGAAGAIGQAIIRMFVDAGYHVLGVDKVPRPDSLALLNHLDWVESDLSVLATDAHVRESLIALVEERLATNRLAVLIHNAATQRLGSFDSITLDDWQQTLAVNLTAPFLMTQSLLPRLEQARGHVIHIGSVHARQTKPGFVAYAMSKAALAGLTRAMAVDLGPRIRVNCIEPAAIDTPMLHEGFAEHPNGLDKLADHHPQKRIGTPEEVASLVLAIVSDDFRFLHGACIPLDGGISGRLHDPD